MNQGVCKELLYNCTLEINPVVNSVKHGTRRNILSVCVFYNFLKVDLAWIFHFSIPYLVLAKCLC